jgi:hypothetical protein
LVVFLKIIDDILKLDIMKIYFIASSRLVDKEPGLYRQMYETIAQDHKMLSDKVLSWIKAGVKDITEASLKVKRENYEQAVKCVKKSDIVVMEVSGHSMSMGYLIGLALEACKPVVALHKSAHSPVFIKGILDPKLLIREYNAKNLEEVIKESMKKASNLIDVRFNFFVSPKILNYLDWVSQKKMVPRSVFLRNLIEKQIKKDREFKG